MSGLALVTVRAVEIQPGVPGARTAVGDPDRERNRCGPPARSTEEGRTESSRSDGGAGSVPDTTRTRPGCLIAASRFGPNITVFPTVSGASMASLAATIPLPAGRPDAREPDPVHAERILFLENSGTDLSELRAIAENENPQRREVEFLSLPAREIPTSTNYRLCRDANPRRGIRREPTSTRHDAHDQGDRPADLSRAR